MSEPLSQSEFSRWAKTNDDQMRRILDHIEDQTERNLTVESRLTAVETGEAKNRRASLGSVVAVVVTAALTALGTWMKTTP